MNEQSAGVITERILIALFASLPPTLMALAAFLTALRAYRQAMTTYRKVDSRMDQLLEEAKNRARLEGSLEAQASLSGVQLPPRGPTRTERGYPDGPRPDLPPPPAPAR